MQGLTRHSLQCHRLSLALAIWPPRHTGVASDRSAQGVGGGRVQCDCHGSLASSVLIAGRSMRDICAQACATCEEPPHTTVGACSLLSPDDSWCFVQNSDSFSGKARWQGGHRGRGGRTGLARASQDSRGRCPTGWAGL